MILATHGLFRGEGFQLADFSMKWHRESLRPDKNHSLMAKPNANERDFEVRMASQCPACLKTNPADAHYCYYDGRPLSKERQDGPLHVGALPFPMAFYFADGQACTNFNQLALACDERWEEAKGLLAQGFWPTFFAGIGRHDLAALAKRAVEEPDRDLGLSQLLEKFPADPEALRPPNLTLGSMEENLGVLSPGTDRTFELTILNRGMLVLRGMVLSNSDWLVFGDRTGPSQKMFQTRSICTIKVRVLGHKLRAGSKPLQGEIIVDTNGGMRTLLVRADVPIVPFPKGGHANDALAGAKSPHEIALRAKQFSNEAAILFEQGATNATTQNGDGQLQKSCYVGISGAVNGLIPGYTEARAESGGGGAGCCGGNIISGGGVLFPNSAVTMIQITDGTSNTICLGEWATYLNKSTTTVDWRSPHGWAMGNGGAMNTNQPPNFNPGGDIRTFNCMTIRYNVNQVNGWADDCQTGVCSNTGANSPLRSEHTGGVNVAMCDGTVRFLPDSTTIDIVARLATRDDGQPVTLP